MGSAGDRGDEEDNDDDDDASEPEVSCCCPGASFSSGWSAVPLVCALVEES